jgi:hypothetical protein
MRNATVYPHWIHDSRAFWYERISADGSEVRIIEGATGRDASLSHWPWPQLLLGHWPLTSTRRSLLKSLEVDADPPGEIRCLRQSWTYDYVSGILAETTKTHDRNWACPDGRLAAILRNHNLWVREIDLGGAGGHHGRLDLYAYADTPASMRVLRAQLGFRG